LAPSWISRLKQHFAGRLPDMAELCSTISAAAGLFDESLELLMRAAGRETFDLLHYLYLFEPLFFRIPKKHRTRNPTYSWRLIRQALHTDDRSVKARGNYRISVSPRFLLAGTWARIKALER